MGASPPLLLPGSAVASAGAREGANVKRICCVAIAAFLLGPNCGLPAEAMPIQPVTVTLGDVPSSRQVRGTAGFQGLPKGVAVQISLKVAGPAPDAALIGTGTCTAYKKLCALKPVRDDLSNSAIPAADMVRLWLR